MTDYYVDPGVNTIQPVLTAQVNSPTADRLILRDGTYTFNTDQAMVFDVSVTGVSYTKLTVMAEHAGLATVNIDDVGFDAIYGGNAQGVTIKDIVLTGTPNSGGVVRDHADSPMTGWTFQNIVLDNMTKPFFDRDTVTPGVGITFRNIVTTAAYGATRVFYVMGSASNLDMLLVDIDGRLHNGAIDDLIHLVDVRDVRVVRPKTFAPNIHGMAVRSFDDAKGVYDIYIIEPDFDGNSVNSSPLIHVGHSSLLKVAKRVYIHRGSLRNSASYGLEFEGGCYDSELVGMQISNSVGNGIAIADTNYNILFEGNIVDGVTGGSNAGIAAVYAQRMRIFNNTISNCESGIRHDESSQLPIPNQRNIIRDNTIYNVSYAYSVHSDAMDSGALSNRFGRNTIYAPSVAFAKTNSGNMTQAQFESAFIGSIEEPDTLIDEIFSVMGEASAGTAQGESN